MKSANHANTSLPFTTTLISVTNHEKDISLLAPQNLSFPGDSTKPRPQSLERSKSNSKDQQTLEINSQDRQVTEGNSGSIISKEASKNLFRDIQKGILIKRKKPNMLFAGEANQLNSAVEPQNENRDSVIAPEGQTLTNEGVNLIENGISQQIEISKLSPGLEKLSGTKTSKKVTFAANNEISVISPKIMTEIPMPAKAIREIGRRAVSNERSFNMAYKNLGERLNFDVQKQNNKILSWSATKVNRTNNISPFKGLDIRSLSREGVPSVQNTRESTKVAQLSSSTITEPVTEKPKSRDNSVNLSSRDMLTQKINSAKLPSIISLSIRAYNKTPNPPPSQEKLSRDNIFKKAVSLFEKESLGRTRYSPSPYNTKMNERKAL